MSSTSPAAPSTPPAPPSPPATTPPNTTASRCPRPAPQPISSESGLKEIQALAEQYLNTGSIPAAATRGQIGVHDVLKDYSEYLRKLVDLSGSRPLKVVVDAGNGMAGLTTPAVLGDALLPKLPFEIIPLYFELDGSFPNHPANPLEPENLRDLQAAVIEHGADIGLAFDGDADRCFVIDEKGEPVSPSAITGMVARREIARAQAQGEATPTIIHNLLTSRAVPELVEHDGGRAVRTRVGHSFIKAVMAEEGAVFGGEHSAHFYFRDFWNADTGMLAAMHVLAALGEQDGPLSELGREYEPYVSSGEINSEIEDKAGAVERVRADFAGEDITIDTMDGSTFTANDGSYWFNLRPSNTEPFLRLNAEATDRATMERVRDRVLALVRALGQQWRTTPGRTAGRPPADSWRDSVPEATATDLENLLGTGRRRRPGAAPAQRRLPAVRAGGGERRRGPAGGRHAGGCRGRLGRRTSTPTR